MGDMIPYHETLEVERDSGSIVVKFDDFEHNVLIEDWYCPEPTCHCMSVGLYFFALNDATMTKDELFFLRLDMNSWEIRERVIAPGIDADQMIAEFMKGLDELHYKDVFKEHYRAVKEYGKKHLQQAQPGFFQISWDTDDDPLAFPYAGQKYLAVEQYCTNPECPCNSVTLNFIRLTKVKHQVPEFVIVLHLGTLQYEVKQHTCHLKKVPDIMKCFLDKRGVLETLRHRYREMKKDGGKSHMKRVKGAADIPEARRLAEPRVGRNDPCPCGSGKKYKKCCGLAG